ncbi:MAG TPA: indolepyruvate oxidoreductase subunit beta [Thermoanaerobaculia bacterium]|nr:indolepyruvate oxidoreductase subunit beta [Thermoanaerobaculia bacterium]
MKYDVIAAGVGGQGVLSIAAIISGAARKSGLYSVQSEVHGMSQRGGAVVAHLRLSDEPIHSATIATGQADLILALEPVESLRYLSYVAPSGALVTSSDPVKNIPNYPDLDPIVLEVLKLPRGYAIDATQLARQCGAGAQAANVVLVGAAADFLPIDELQLRSEIAAVFARKGERVVEANLKAFEAGRGALRHRDVVDEFETLSVH